MPVYNALAFLPQALDSIIAQTFDDFECLMLDDESTDGSLSILEKYASNDVRMKTIRRKHTGHTYAMNEGLALARGSLIAIMHADDICLPQRFQRQLLFLNAHPDCVAAGATAVIMDADGDHVGTMVAPLDHATIDAGQMTGIGGQIPHPSVMFRRQAVLAVGGYRPDFEPAEDLDLFLRLAEVGKLANLPEVLLKYRLHTSNASVRRTNEQLRNSWRAVREACQRRTLPIPAERVFEGATQSVIDQRKSFVRSAIESGYLKSARKHALWVVTKQPWCGSTWRLLFRAFTGMRAATAFRIARKLGLIHHRAEGGPNRPTSS
jgi:glycosyltransferase involved in cell wall biosynthesis